MSRRTLTRAEFDARCLILEKAFPQIIRTSGVRTESHNAAVGGGAGSRHVAYNCPDGECVAADYDWIGSGEVEQAMLVDFARDLGFWGLWHKGHLHVQGVAPA